VRDSVCVWVAAVSTGLSRAVLLVYDSDAIVSVLEELNE